MPEIRVRPFKDALGAPIGINATLRAQLMVRVGAHYSPAVRLDGPNLLFPHEVTVPLNSVGITRVTLQRSAENRWWMITVTDTKNYRLTRDILFPAGAVPCDFDELIDIERAASIPIAPPDLSALDILNRAESAAQRAEEAVLIAGITYVQASAASSWPITHGFGHLPVVTVYDADGSVVGADISSTPTTTNISFAFPVAGSARLN